MHTAVLMFVVRPYRYVGYMACEYRYVSTVETPFLLKVGHVPGYKLFEL